MKLHLKSGALLLALFTILSLCTACQEATVTSGCTPSDIPASNPEESLPETDSDLPPVSTAPSEPSSKDESKANDQIVVNNTLERLKNGYAATMAASSLKLTGEISYYEAAAGKGDTLVYPISYALQKGENDVYKALLSYGGEQNTDLYYNDKYIYERVTEKQGEYYVNQDISNDSLTIETTLMPVLNDVLSIVSFNNVFTRFCQSDYGVELNDGVYTFYFYGSYTELARILLEDDEYNLLLENDIEQNFPTNAGSIEIHLTEDGYFAGISTSLEFTSETESHKNYLSYTFTDFNADFTVEAPEWIAYVE